MALPSCGFASCGGKALPLGFIPRLYRATVSILEVSLAVQAPFLLKSALEQKRRPYILLTLNP
ncbi:hypothetical protein HRTV-25_gp112 [Halorubrum tailed virus 25]|uniref:Uncharacterized protein n=1 Tax=Halorubrum tailed virus 25 TaxID=2878006 RepID=A0AAE8Y154_9CAUD|nr:hypothetical protein M1M37_gp112 [Halorubrum tailed virus 25]UBF22693.1 hypothetical protein HRTV-25_gp112 [Halorubrum tailed virus 25]